MITWGGNTVPPTFQPMANETRSRSRGWCFTINNPNTWDDLDLERCIEESKYLIYGKEVGENGTPHYQGYVYFSTVKSFLQVKEYLQRAHIEKQKGPLSKAVDYCKKDGDFKEFGERPYGNDERKNQWKDVLQLARQGDLQAIEDKYPMLFLRYHSKLSGLYRPERPLILDALENEWWVGPTGSGKSRSLWERYPDHYQKSLNKWWDGYTNQETVAIEEWSPKNECTASFLKIWADRYPFSAEIKGGTLQKVRPRRIIVLSNYSIEACFEREEDRGPLFRRFKIVHFFSF